MFLRKKIRLLFMLICGSFLFFPAGRAGEMPAAARREALRVIRFLDKLEAESLLKKPSPLRRMDFTESELNSYIVYRIEMEKSNVMKELRLKLFEANRIEGKIFVDLRGEKLSAGLKPQMNLYFEGVLVTQNGQARLDFRKLFLESQSISPMFLDLVIFIASKLSKFEAGSILDWYALPLGIKDVRTGSGRIFVYY